MNLLLTILTLLVFVVCLTIRVGAYIQHQTLSLPFWTGLAFLAVMGLVFEPVFKRIFKR